MSEMDLTRPGSGSTPARRGAGPALRSDDRLRRIVEGELLPRFLVSHHVGPMPASFAMRGSSKESLAGEFSEFLTLVRSPGTRERLDRYLDETLDRGYPVEAVFDDLITPVARRMGILWEEDECDFFEVTVVCTRLQAAIRRLSSRYTMRLGTPRGRVLVGGLPGAEHSLGFLMVAECFARNGFSVSLGEPLVHGIHPGGFDALALSVTRTEQAELARDYVQRARGLAGPGLRIIVGGYAFRSDPGLIDYVGADGWAEDPESALGLLRRMLDTTPTTMLPHELIPERPRRA